MTGSYAARPGWNYATHTTGALGDVTTSATTNYATSVDGDGTVHQQSVIDYTPRMISRTVTTGGVTFETDAQGHIVYDAQGNATIADAGLLMEIGQLDPQKPGATSPTDYFIGAENPGVSPTNGWFVLFGQFFDHGLDFIDKASPNTIKITLAADDPLYGMIGNDGQPVHEITITRATVTGHNEGRIANLRQPDGAS